MRLVRAALHKPKLSKLGFNSKGGVQPALYKEETLRSRIMPMPLPNELKLCLKQFDDKLLIPVVSQGDEVKKYDLLAQPANESGVPLYAPTSGRIQGIESLQLPSAFSEEAPHIVICVDGKESESDAFYPMDFAESSRESLFQRLEKSGIGGLGGADYPLHLKLSHALNKQCHTTIINAAECEPYICCDEALIREYAEEVVLGAKVLQYSIGASNCFIAIEDSKTAAIEALTSATNSQQIELVILDTKYPAGHERGIVEAVTKVKIPANSRPTDRGICVHNAGTAFAAYNATLKGKPCISRITTVAGRALLTPKNFIALFGTPVPFLFQLCGINKEQHTGTLVGGSMMGVALPIDNISVSRSVNCIVAQTLDSFPTDAIETACIRCGFCAESCPIHLQPQLLYGFSRSQNYEQLNELNLQDCIECGACAYICPSKIPLVQYFRGSKATIEQLREDQKLSEKWQDRFQYNQYRSKKLKDESKARKPRKIANDNIAPVSTGFSRDKAKAEIADAVNRVKLKKLNKNKTSP